MLTYGSPCILETNVFNPSFPHKDQAVFLIYYSSVEKAGM